MPESWHKVAAEADVSEDEPVSTKLGDVEIGIYRVDGQFYALEDVCPHAYALLSEGFVEDGNIECPLHGAVFHIPTGKCLRDPAERDLKTYEVKIEGGDIYVRL